jgi:hypothetical protein
MLETDVIFQDTTSTGLSYRSPTATDGNRPIVWVDPPPCERHAWRRIGTGPYPSRSPIWVIADCCRNCSWIEPVRPDKLSWKASDWVRRWNARVEREQNDLRNKTHCRSGLS